MNSRNAATARWIAVATLAMSGVTWVAAQTATDSPRSRADVVSETLAARASGVLTPAGQGPSVREGNRFGVSTATRSEIASEVVAARRAGDLVPAGEGPISAPSPVYGGSIVARSAVKAEVIAARRGGELIPAGQGPEPELQARAERTADWLARKGRSAEKFARR